MSKSYQDLRKAIADQRVPSLVFIVYEEPYLVRQLERSLKAQLVQPGAEALDYQEFSGRQASELSLPKLEEICQSPPFMSARKLIQIKDSGLFQPGRNNASPPAFKPEHKADWQSFLTRLPADLCLVFREAKIDRRQRKFWQALEESGAWIVEVKRPDETTLFQWLNALAGKEGLNLSRSAAEELCQRCDLEMDNLASEMNKLSSIAKARNQQEISLALVEEAGRPNLNGDVFQLLDHLAKGQVKQAMIIKNRLLERREPLQLIQFMLARKIRQLIIAKELNDPASLAKRLKLPPFVARKLISEARGFKSQDLEQKYRALFLTDWQIKQGKLPDDLGFDLALLEIGGLKQKL